MTLFQHDRPVPPAWQAALEAIVPKQDRLSWLQLAWMPGMVYEPVQRFVIYEMLPDLDLVHPDWLADIRGPSPRTVGTWIADPSVPEHLGGHRWASSSMHSLLQWQLFREHNAYPRLFWLLQGDKGGHVWRLDAPTRNYRMSLGVGDVPNPGDLSYAEWDNRVAEQIMRYDRLKKWQAQMAQPWTDRSLNKTEAGLLVSRETWDLEKAYAAEMLKLMDAEIEDAVRDIPQRLLPTWSDLPPGDGRYNEGAEELERHLIEDTTHNPN